MLVKKIGLVSSEIPNNNWWKSHMMAPAPIMLSSRVIRVYLGCWNAEKISRIGYVDVDAADPTKILSVSQDPVLDIGRDGCFDENGVFPAHAYRFKDGRIYLYYTGFQLGHKIRHYNFGGLAVSEDGLNFVRHSEAPILDRADEGLFVRAGQSIESDEKSGFHSVYSAGSGWYPCEGELRPVYDIFYQHTPDGISLKNNGKHIISCDFSVEHGLGRPQIIKLGRYFYIFYTRRIIKNMRYFIGVARSLDCVEWERIDSVFDGVFYGEKGTFDSEMIYFPGVVKVSIDKAFLFYSGNYFGQGGLGVIEITF